MSKHTPGEWKLEPYPESDGAQGITVYVNGDESLPITPIAHIRVEHHQSEANARLIASAPGMHICCEAALSYLLLEEHLDKTQLISELRRVLAKAEGNS